MVARFLPFLVAFVATVVVIAGCLYFAVTQPLIPPDSLVVSAPGHTEEARAALLAAQLPNVRIVEYRSVGRSSFGHTVTYTAARVAACLLVFGAFAVLSRRLFHGTPTI